MSPTTTHLKHHRQKNFPRMLPEILKKPLKKFLPYGTLDSWEDLNPSLYHAVHIYCLKFYGMWFISGSPWSILYWVQVIYGMVVLCLVCILPGIGEVVYLLKRRDNVGDIAEGLYLFLSEMYTYFKMVVFWMNKQKILALLEYLHCDEFRPAELEHRGILLRSITTARSLMTYYSTMCVGAVTVGILMPISEGFDILPTNVEYPFFDVYSSPIYQIMYLHHIYYKPATCIIDGVLDTILAAFIASAIGQIDILSFNLRNFTVLAERRRSRLHPTDSTYESQETKQDNIRAVLKDCIKHHYSIIRFVSMIEDAFSLASMLQFMLSAMVLCLIGIQFLSIENPTSHPIQLLWTAIYLTCMLIEVFIMCWFGDELISKSNDLRQAAFDGPWLSIEGRDKKFIIMFMEKCKRPMNVTAGKIFTLSLDTYTVLINWSYKAFAVMRNMKN